MRSIAWGLAAPALLSFAAPAAASVFAWDFAGSGYTASGTFVVNDANSISNPLPCAACANGPGYLVTGITGSINGAAITGLASPNTFFFNDNRFYYQTTNGALDALGIAFNTSSDTFKIFAGDYSGHVDQTFLLVTGDTRINFEHPIDGHANLISGPVPEPATWALMIAGFGFIGSALRRMRRQRALKKFAF